MTLHKTCKSALWYSYKQLRNTLQLTATTTTTTIVPTVPTPPAVTTTTLPLSLLSRSILETVTTVSRFSTRIYSTTLLLMNTSKIWCSRFDYLLTIYLISNQIPRSTSVWIRMHTWLALIDFAHRYSRSVASINNTSINHIVTHYNLNSSTLAFLSETD
jgi:hypothetical protein